MISAVIITKNEEKNILDCIKSVKWVDEVILVDSGSTDKTLDLVKEQVDELIIKEWTGFSDAKNIGIERAQGSWILSIDADERITDDLKDELLRVSKLENDIDGYYIPRLLFFCGKPVRYGGCYPDYQLRFFKKEKGLFNNAPVHESVKLEGKTARLKNHMLHYSYNNMKDYWTRFNFYTTLDAQKKKEKGKTFHLFDLFILHLELFKRLILKRGILDGIPGIFYHIFSAVSSLVKYAKLWEINSK